MSGTGLDAQSVIHRLVQQGREKRVAPVPRQAMALLDKIDFDLERSVLGLPPPQKAVPKASQKPLLVPKPAAKPGPLRPGTIVPTSSSTSVTSTHIQFVEFEAPLDPWEAIQDDMQELRSVLNK